MATKKQLLDRWKREPWREVDERLVAFTIRQATAAEPWAAPDPEEIFGMLEGLPHREEVPSGRDLRGSSFPGARNMDLRETDFSYCHAMEGFADCDLRDARLDHIRGDVYDLTGHIVKASFKGARLRKTIMERSRFDHCDFEGADLSSASLRGSDLRGSSLRDAKLKGADLQECDLRDCDFREADLSGALICGSVLEKTTRFEGAVLTNLVYEELRDNRGRLVLRGAEWRSASYDETTIFEEDAAAVDREVLALIIDEARKSTLPWASQFATTARQHLDRLKEDPSFRWYESLLETVPPRVRAEAEGLMQRASMKL